MNTLLHFLARVLPFQEEYFSLYRPAPFYLGQTSKYY